MSNKLRLLLIIFVTVLVANVAWRLWANRGRVTIDANDEAVAEVVRSLQRQGGIRVVSNVPAETKVTMHVRKVPLLHALEVLAANAGASWSVAYFAAADKGAIETALGALAGGNDPEGWKRWSMPPMRGFGDEGGSVDPRFEEWQPKLASEGNLHAYLGQASTVLSAQFWAPEPWNPAVSAMPKPGRITDVMPKLAKAAGGKSVEVFLLRARPSVGDFAGAPRPPDAQTNGPRFDFREPSEEMRKAMEERMNAQIERLPKNKQAEARARMEEGRKMFAEMANLSPEERRAKMEENMEKMMSNSDTAARMSAEGTKRGAMQTAEQRAERYRDYLDKKREMNQ